MTVADSLPTAANMTGMMIDMQRHVYLFLNFPTTVPLLHKHPQRFNMAKSEEAVPPLKQPPQRVKLPGLAPVPLTNVLTQTARRTKLPGLATPASQHLLGQAARHGIFLASVMIP